MKKSESGEFEKDYPESPVNESIRPKKKEFPKEDKRRKKSVKEEYERTKNQPTSMQ